MVGWVKKRESAHGGRRVRVQPWTRHVTNQMTKLVLGHKEACKSRLVLDLSQANRIECAVRAVIKLYFAPPSSFPIDIVVEVFSSFEC